MNDEETSTPPPRTAGPRSLPGEEAAPPVRAGGGVAGLVVVLVLLVALVIARPGLVGEPAVPDSSGSGPSTEQTNSGAVVPTGHTTEVTISVEGMSFAPSTIEVPVGDALRITLDNTGDQRHDLVLDTGASTGAVAPGARGQLDAGIITTDVDGWCSISGHRQMGMTLKIIATGAKPGVSSPSSDPASSPGSSPGADPNAGSIHGSTSGPTSAELSAQAHKSDAARAELPGIKDPGSGSPAQHSYTFTVTEHSEQVADGLTRSVWTYNGTSPGPLLRGKIGDTFTITLVNNGTMGHSIDFHAGEIAPDAPMKTIEPGESLTYTFTAHRSGIWMYHCSTPPMSSHIANGLFGAVIIAPDNLEDVDREYVLIQSELYLAADGEAADADKIAAGTPDAVVFNGRAFQYDAHPLTAEVGQRVRIWVLDAGPDEPLSFHVVGAQFDTVWKEGAYSVHHGTSTDGLTRGTTGSQTLGLQVAEGGFVEFTTHQAGTYPFVNHQMSLAEKGAHGLLVVSDATK